MTIKSWMIYGAYGYTGDLIVKEAVRRGHLPIIAGRQESLLLPMAEKYGLDYRRFDLIDYRKVKKDIEGCGIVLNCAGPFSHTANSLRKACIEAGVHYLDITGEIDVLEASCQSHADARRNGCVVISGVGFDVVPTDFLAYYLKLQLPSATHLELAFAGNGGISPGTAKTMVEMLVDKGCIREGGEMKQVPLAYDSKNIRFSDESRLCATIAWGDVCTAFYTTEIPNIRVYTAMEAKQIKWMRHFNGFVKVLNIPFVQKWIKGKIAQHVKGPSESVRANGFMRLWGKASVGEQSVEVCMDTPEGYAFTVLSALLFVEALLAHKILPGAYTPAQALPQESIFGMQGVKLYVD